LPHLGRSLARVRPRARPFPLLLFPRLATPLVRNGLLLALPRFAPSELAISLCVLPFLLAACLFFALFAPLAQHLSVAFGDAP
jgi:hypothetical protein